MARNIKGAVLSGVARRRQLTVEKFMTGQTKEVLIAALADEGFEKINKVPGELSKLLWSRGKERGVDIKEDASMHMVRFVKGTGIPVRHKHASNQFMYCISGQYHYESSGLTLNPGDFYYNPAGEEHGPTVALEDCVLLEIYDGPHYAILPDFEYQKGEQKR